MLVHSKLPILPENYGRCRFFIFVAGLFSAKFPGKDN
jgi:hypothetical protein